MNGLAFVGYVIETDALTMAELEATAAAIDKKTEAHIAHHSPLYDDTRGIFDVFRRIIWEELSKKTPHIQFKTNEMIKNEVTA